MGNKKFAFILSCTILILCGIATASFCAKTYMSVSNKTGVVQESVSTAKMTQRIREAAKTYEQYAPLPRAAFVDTCVPRDIEEYKALDTHCIVMISAVTQDPDELPLKSVYIPVEDKKITLECLGSVKVKIKDPLIKKVFGKNRMDYYFLLPYAYTILDAELTIDWGANRDGMAVYKYTGEVKPRYIMEAKDRGELILPRQVPIDRKALKGFLLSEFGVSFPDKQK